MFSGKTELFIPPLAMAACPWLLSHPEVAGISVLYPEAPACLWFVLPPASAPLLGSVIEPSVTSSDEPQNYHFMVPVLLGDLGE